MEEHIVLFMDFLGFKNAVANWKSQQISSLIQQLNGLANNQSQFGINSRTNGNSTNVTISSNITTFSDHIVASYPYKPNNLPEGMDQNAWEDMVLQHMQKIAAHFTIMGLDLGLLARGGLSRGDLYHNGRVVMGKAMIDAYELESKVAQYPRIAVANNITNSNRIYPDIDDKNCLEYFTEMMIALGNNAQQQGQTYISDIDNTITKLKQNMQYKKAANWCYFRENLKNAVATWP